MVMVTRREIEAACQIAEGRTYDEAGAAMSISPETVKTLLRSGRQKAGAPNTAALVASLLVEKLMFWDTREGRFRPNRAMFGG